MRLLLLTADGSGGVVPAFDEIAFQRGLDHLRELLSASKYFTAEVGQQLASLNSRFGHSRLAKMKKRSSGSAKQSYMHSFIIKK